MKKKKELSNWKVKKLATLVGKGQLVVGVVNHVLGDDNTGEFDPYFVDRIKNSL